jgi:hypothetical protein
MTGFEQAVLSQGVIVDNYMTWPAIIGCVVVVFFITASFVLWEKHKAKLWLLVRHG